MIDFKKKLASLIDAPAVSGPLAIYREKVRPLVTATGKVASTVDVALAIGLKAIAFGPIGHSLIVPVIIATVGLLSFASPTGEIDLNACGISTNNWCVMANGWTKFTPKTRTSGTCSNSSGTSDGTCIIAVTTSGNDGTCAAERADLAGVTSSESLSSFVPALPCATLPVAKGKVRSGKPDWMVLKKGDSWDGGINGPLNGNFAGTGGLSNSDLMLVTAYGVGVRPMLRKVVYSTDGLILFNSAAGNYTAVTGLKLYDAVSDPTNATYYNGYTVTGDTTASNGVITNVSPAVNADVIANPSRYSIMGTGIPSTGATLQAIASATSSTITLAGGKLAGLSSTGATLQITGTNTQAGLGWSGGTTTLNTAIVEDMDLTWSNLSIPYGTSSSSAGVNVRIRRNIISHTWNRPFGGSTFFSATNTATASDTILIEENVQNWGGFYPDLWSGSVYVQTHCMYLHDISYFTLKKNITADCSNTGAQNRDAGTAYNNLWIRSPTQQYTNTGRGNTSVSYDVYDSASEVTYANRTAKAASACVVNPPSAPCATNIKFEGITAYIGNGGVGINNTDLINLDNPGSIVGRTLYSDVTAYDTITLSTNSSGTSPGVYAGIRGDGVRVGDRLRSVTNSGIGLENARGGHYPSPGVATGTIYAGPTNVTVSNGTPILVTETGAAATRPIDEPFKFTSGTLPTPLTTTDTYCTVAQGFTYNIYPATAGPTINGATSYSCPGVASNTIDATGGSTATNIPRTGSRKYLFNNSTSPYTTAVPTWLTQGMSVIFPNSPSQFTGNNSWVASVAADRQSFLTTDSSITGIATGQIHIMFDAPNTTNVPTIRLGPNNVFTRALQRAGAGGNQNAIILDRFNFAVDASGNYLYNYNTNAANNTQDNSAVGWTGNGLTPSAFAATNTISVNSQVLNLANSTAHPLAYTAAYDASVGGRTITGTLTANGFGGAWLDTSDPVVIDDYLFDNTGSNPITQYSQIVYQMTSTRYLVSGNTQTLGPISMKLGSYEHFMTNALSQSKEAGWNATYTANAANNFIRDAIGCTAASTPACPAQ